MKLHVIPFVTTILLVFLCSSIQAQDFSVYTLSGKDFLAEGCEDTIAFELNIPSDTAVKVEVNFSGSAERNIDYTISTPDTLTYEPSDTVFNYILSSLADGITENEEIIISIVILDNGYSEDYSFDFNDELLVNIMSDLDSIKICQGDTLTLSASGARNYIWETDQGIEGSSDSSSISINIQDDGYVYVEGTLGNCTSRDSIYINYLADENSGNIVEDTVFICLGDEAILNTEIIPANATITWSPDSAITDINSPSPTVDPSVTTMYYLNVETDECSFMDSVLVRVDSLPDVGLVSLPPPNPDCGKYCRGDIIKIASDDIIMDEKFPDIEFQWENNGTLIDGIDSLESSLVQVDEDRTYYRNIVNNACTDIDSIEILVVDPEVLTLDDTTVCFEMPVDITIDETDLTDFEWTPEEGLSCTDCAEPTARPTQTTTYTLTATKESCCPVTTSITITVDIPPIDLPVLFTCPFETIITDFNLEGSYTDPQWSGVTEELSCTDCFDPEITTGESRVYGLEAIDNEGCLSRGQLAVNVYPQPTITLMTEPQNNIPVGGSVEISVEVDPEQTNAEYVWYYNGDQVDVTGEIVSLPIIEEGPNNTYEVRFIDNNGCPQSATVTLNGIEPVVKVPNAFTPNNDDRNDFFRPVLENAEFVPNFVQEFQVSNRFGKVIYTYEDNEEGWDGTINSSNEPAPPEVYFYYIKLLYPNGDEEIKKGEVTLLR